VNPIFTPNDVSVIVLTLKPHPGFKTCLIRLFENKPAEIIICTTEEHIKEVEHIISEAVLKGVRRSTAKIVVSEKGARKQLMKGVWEAKGKIIATTDDNTFWSRNYLINLLPCFEGINVRIILFWSRIHIRWESLCAFKQLQRPNSSSTKEANFLTR
jgi:hypothetical protein